MKKLLTLFLTGMLVLGQVNAETFKSPDILIDSKLDYDWSGVLISKFRLLLKNYKMTDPFIGHYPERILVNESEIGDLLPKNSKDMIRDFGNSIGLSLLKTKTKVTMDGFAYEVKGFKTNLKTSESQADGLVVETEFSASEVNFSAEKITLSVVIPNSGASAAPLFEVDIINPVIQAHEDDLINFFANIKIHDNQDFYKLKILKANFDKMANRMVKRQQNINLDYERIVIPEVSLKIGNKTVNFHPEKIERILRDNHEAIKGIILAQAANTLRANTTQAAFRVLEQYKLNKEYWMATKSLQSQIKIGKFSASKSGNNIEIDMPGDFCTNMKFDQLQKQCVNSKKTNIADTRLNKKMHASSLVTMKDMMDRGDANFVASISEDYLNKLLVTTYDAGLWKAALDEAGVDLGPNRVIMKLDKQGDSGTLIMDVVYKPSRLEKAFTGTKVIRFPLVLNVAIRIEKHDDQPVVIIRLNDVDTSDQTIIHGRPNDNIISTVKDVPRFKNKVANAIRSKVGGLRGKDIIELRYPQFSGLGLDRVDFLSDGNGRMNAIMRLEDLIEENIY